MKVLNTGIAELLKTHLAHGRLVGLVRKWMIAVGGMLLVFATLAFTRRAPTDLIPESSTIAGYAPVSPAFGYDPQYTSGLYGHDLTFYNFDPEAHPEQPLYKKALGLFLTHTTNHVVNPLWARASAESILGTPRERLRDMGWLPSPFRYQTDNWTYLAMHSGWLGDVRVPVHVSLSLNETLAEKDGSTLTFLNCHLCHSGIYGDNVVGGAPNKNLNPEWARRRILASGISEFRESWKKEHRVPAPRTPGALLAKLLSLTIRERDGQLLFDSSTYQLEVMWDIMGPKTTQVVGAAAGAATWLVFADAAHYKKDARDLDDFQTPEDAKKPGGMLDHVRSWNNNTHALATPRPWWVARYMGLHFWPGVTPAGGDASAGDLMMDLHTPHYGSAAAPSAQDRWRISQALQTYIATIDSPPFPRPIDSAKAALGMVLYNRACARCHGAVEPLDGAPVGPNKMLKLVYDQNDGYVLLDEVETDPEYIKEGQHDQFIVENYLKIPDAKKHGLVQDGPRPDQAPYIYAPPLVGVWASAPYLHNGSVPNVYGMLKEDERPTYWALDEDPYAYDYEKMGVVYQSLPSMPARREEPSDWRVYDTTRKINGMTNVGHPFGRSLTDDQRYQIIEFLKCLNTTNVKPEVVAH